MKKIIFLACLLTFTAHAANQKDFNIAVYQELCAKEHDPIKRHHYCHIFERDGKLQAIPSVFRKDIALV